MLGYLKRKFSLQSYFFPSNFFIQCQVFKVVNNTAPNYLKSQLKFQFYSKKKIITINTNFNFKWTLKEPHFVTYCSPNNWTIPYIAYAKTVTIQHEFHIHNTAFRFIPGTQKTISLTKKEKFRNFSCWHNSVCISIELRLKRWAHPTMKDKWRPTKKNYHFYTYTCFGDTSISCANNNFHYYYLTWWYIHRRPERVRKKKWKFPLTSNKLSKPVCLRW